jgi:hypothetical protein
MSCGKKAIGCKLLATGKTAGDLKLAASSLYSTDSQFVAHS